MAACVAAASLFAACRRITGCHATVSRWRPLATVAHNTEVHYTQQHEWIRRDGAVASVGITDKAAETLGELVFVDLVESPVDVEQGDVCGSVESVKAVSEIYSPVSGRIVETNQSLVDKPSLLNKNPQGENSWLFRIELTKPDQLAQLMSHEQYSNFLENE